MTKSDLQKLLGSPDRDPGCDAGLDVIDVYCETVVRGEPIAGRFTEFLTHLSNCTACREDTESLMAVLREQEKSGAG